MRIASLAPSATIMLQELGAADEIVACTSMCPLPVLERQQKTVGTFSVLNEAKIAEAKPDLILTATLVQASGSARLKEQGYTVLHFDPKSLTDIADNYAQLGEYIEKKREGQELRQQFLHNLTQANPTHIKIYMEEWHEPPFVSGNWVPDMVKHAGAESVLIEPGQPSRQITLEELQQTDPDIIIQHVCLPPLWLDASAKALAQRTNQREIMKQKLLAREGWNKLKAVKNAQVYSLDDTPFNMPTLGVLKGIPLLQQIISSWLAYSSSPVSQTQPSRHTAFQTPHAIE